MSAVVRACFFLSGASGLIFELLWTRMLTLVFGSTTLAVSTVLAAFMGGLGLGSYLAGRSADRVRDPVKVYAILEGAIGVYALLVPWVIGHYPALNQWMWSALGDRYALLSLVRFAASAALLLLPTTLMGATLPVLARHFVSRSWEGKRIGARLGVLYAINLFGAFAGAFMAGFVLLPTLGVRTTNVVAASFNLTLFAIAMLARRKLRARAESESSLDELLERAEREGHAEAARTQPPPVVMTPAARRVVLVGFAVSGATAMTLQGLWTRALAVVIGSSIYSFTIILLAFLVGLGVGSAFFGRRADRTAHPVRWLAVSHLGIAVAVGLTYLFVDDLPYAFAFLLGSPSFGVDTVLVAQFVLACLTVLPATLLMGAVFPLTMRAVAGRVEAVGRDVGFAYAINTVGAITGSFLSGFVVLPTFGLQRGIYASVAAGLAVAVALVLVAPELAPRKRALGVAAALGLAVLGLVLPRWNLVAFSQGFFRVSIAKEYIQRRAERKAWQTPELVFYEDGVATTVTVDRWGKTYSMKNNGKVDASSDADMPTQVSVGLLPLLLHPAETPPKVALVGFGSGVTAGAITRAPIASLEVIELEPAIYRASHFFDHVNHRPLEHPRVTARVGDGRNFLGQRSDRFDVIISQPSNPWITGVSNLFTREYFEDVKSRLAPRGIFCQWAQLYEIAPWNVKTIYRTLRASFPHVYVFAAEDLSSDTILIASMEPLPLDVGRVERALAHPDTAAEARRAGWQSAYDVVAQVLLTPDEIDAFTAGAPLNTDDNARIELQAPRDLLGYARFDPYLAKVYGAQWPYGRLAGVVAGLEGDDRSVRMARLARSLLAHGKHREAETWTRRAEAAGGGPESEHARTLLRLVATRLDRDPEVPLFAGGPLPPAPILPTLTAAQKEDVERGWREVAALVEDRRFATAYKVMESWPTALWDKPPTDFALLAGFLHYKNEFYGDAVDLLKPLAANDDFVKAHPEVLYYLGRAHFAHANYGKSVALLERWLEQRTAAGAPILPIPPAAAAPVSARP